MLVSLPPARAWVRCLATSGTALLPLAACSGGDLLLPDDRTPARLEVVSGDGQSAVVGSPVPNPLVVEARDREGRPVEGAIILFEFVDPPNGAAIAPSATETSFDGRASVEVTLGTPPALTIATLATAALTGLWLRASRRALGTAATGALGESDPGPPAAAGWGPAPPTSKARPSSA